MAIYDFFQGCIKLLIPEEGKFNKSVGEEYQVVKRGREYHGRKRGKKRKGKQYYLLYNIEAVEEYQDGKRGRGQKFQDFK